MKFSNNFHSRKFNTFYILFIFIYFFNFNLKANQYTDSLEKNFPTIEYVQKNKQEEYIIGPGDIIEIVFIQIDENNEYNYINKIVKGDGTIFLNRFGSLYVEGLTIDELTKILEEKYKVFLKFPKIEIRLKEYRPIKVYIEGEIPNPGLYTLKGSYSKMDLIKFSTNPQQQNIYADKLKDPSLGISIEEKNNFSTYYFPTLFDLIRNAGGITNHSNLSNIEVIRINPLSKGGGKIKASINLLDMINNGDKTSNIRLLDGDYIKVSKSINSSLNQLSNAMKSNLNPKFINVNVTGRVENPGFISLSRCSTLNDAINITGGLKFGAGHINFIRFNQDGTLEKRSIRYRKRNSEGSFSNPYLKSGDIISISKGKFKQATEILTEITTPFINAYGTYKIFSD